MGTVVPEGSIVAREDWKSSADHSLNMCVGNGLQMYGVGSFGTSKQKNTSTNTRFTNKDTGKFCIVWNSWQSFHTSPRIVA